MKNHGFSSLWATPGLIQSAGTHPAKSGHWAAGGMRETTDLEQGGEFKTVLKTVGEWWISGYYPYTTQKTSMKYHGNIMVIPFEEPGRLAVFQRFSCGDTIPLSPNIPVFPVELSVDSKKLLWLSASARAWNWGRPPATEGEPGVQLKNRQGVLVWLQRCCWIVFEDALGLGIPRSKGGLSIFFVGREDPNSHRLQYLLNQSIYIHLS